MHHREGGGIVWNSLAVGLYLNFTRVDISLDLDIRARGFDIDYFFFSFAAVEAQNSQRRGHGEHPRGEPAR